MQVLLRYAAGDPYYIRTYGLDRHPRQLPCEVFKSPSFIADKRTARLKQLRDCSHNV